MRFPLLITCLFCLWATTRVDAQVKKTVTASRVQGAVIIDGQLTEPCWMIPEFASDFIELKPNPGLPSSHQTCVRILYDDTGIYIGAELEEEKMDRLGNEILERDNFDDSKKVDWFGVALDCYQNGLNGYAFIVSAAGVQSDIKFLGDDEDGSWDAVWDSKVHQYDHYWTCEIKIPYSALRFPDQEEQKWAIQFGRRSFQGQDESFWNPIDPNQNGFLTQAGILEGIREIKPPVRFSATPFFAVYAENYKDPSSAQKSVWGSSFNGGMDIKYGISDAYTLDMTLIPDFGQVQSDNEVLNLSPFEVYFGENRQFFTEGTELFNRADLFYSRRVGGTPYYYDKVYDELKEDETVKEIKSDSRLMNATKISGRGKRGLGLGYFNAISPRDYSVVKNNLTGVEHKVLLQPWTNYNILVVDQSLRNNSYVSLINTNVWREGNAGDANVTGVEFDLRDKKNNYGIAGDGAISRKDPKEEANTGFKYNIEVARHSGEFIWGLSYHVLSDTYDPNDLGFLGNNNVSSWGGYGEYNEYKPFGIFLRGSVGASYTNTSLYRFPGAEEEQYRPNLFTGMGINAYANGLLKNYFFFNLWWRSQPTKGYDYFEPRVAGRFHEYPAFNMIGLDLQSDSRKKWIAGGNIRYNAFNEANKYQFAYGFYTNYRINNHFSAGYEFQHLLHTLERGYITEINDSIVFGEREYRDLTQVIKATYTFTPEMTLSMRLRHNWTRVQYTDFYTLLEDGTLADRLYYENEDINYNAWTIDVNFRWRFAPGSDMYFVWKNSIYGNNQKSMISYSDNLHELFDNPQTNSFSVKLLYYIDFQRWKQNTKNK